MSPGNIYLAEAALDFNFSITNAGDGPSNCIFVDQADGILLMVVSVAAIGSLPSHWLIRILLTFKG